ncbi:MAG: recA-like protein [Novosphingobium sp.]|nr:recA-like protein [Novosphingobium sp.]MBO9602997.1 recA-like protein [Novosphingobium sp.]
MTAQAFPSPFAAAVSAAAAHWRPGLVADRHSEIFAPAAEASGAGMALSLALDGLRASGLAEGRRAILWVQDRNAIRLGGRPCRAGLPAELRARLIHVAAQTPEDALFALEEGLRCRELACVIGELTGNPKALGLTASRRLSLAAERHGVPLFLIRLDARRDLSSARMRWEVHSSTSPPRRWNPAAPGTPSWRAELFRARGYRQGEWILHDDGTRLVAGPSQGAAADHGDLAAVPGDRSLAAL